MSGTALDVILQPRLGARPSLKRQRAWIGSDVPVWIDVRSVLTGQLVPGATGAAAWYRSYMADGSNAPDQPLTVTEPTPGTLHVVVPCDLPGTCEVGIQIAGPSRAAAHITFDVASNGGLTVTASGVIPYGDIQSVAVAAALSAVRPEIRRTVVEESAAAVGEAVGAAMQGIGDAAAAAATEAVAGQLAGKASTADVSALGVQVGFKADAATTTLQLDGKATKAALQAIALRVESKADVATTDRLEQQLALLAAAIGDAPRPTKLDFGNPLNSGLLLFL